jgi:hypothetical protein
VLYSGGVLAPSRRVKKSRPVLRLLAFDHCRTLAPWCAVRSGTTPTLQVRRIAHELEQSASPRPTRIEAGLAQMLNLVYSLRQILIVWRPAAAGVRRHYGITRGRQFIDLLRTVWHGNLMPRGYYFQRFFRQADPAAYLQVIDHRELQLLLRAIHRGADTTILDDKAAFHAFCAEHGLPTPPILAMYINGHCKLAPESEDGWRVDLFSKPSRSYSSRGIACWRYDASRDQHTDGKTHLDRSALQALLAAQSGENCLIVQPRIQNSSDLAPISANALANCRVVTARQPDGTIRVLLAVLRMGVGEAITSDEPSKSFCAAINVETGELGLADAKQAEHGSFTHHPESKAPITGNKLSHWSEMKAIALRAHAQLPQMIFIGWDVIDTANGPMLLEGNVVWGGNLAQMAGNLPLGATGFPEIFLHYYSKGRPAPGDREMADIFRSLALEAAHD